MSGKVVLVGAGPGDPGLFTIKGREILSKAEVVVYDRLLSSAIMDMIPESAERVDVGKRVAHHPVPQSEINRILLEKAQEGKLVVRLKGGDPFMFGRGGEELELLVENGVPFEVVPGVTSALSVPAYGGIPVTHRDCCSSLHIVTGSARAGKDLSINYDALVGTNGTLVFLMGVAPLPEICQGLLDAGMSPDMPAAIVEHGTLPSQRRISATLSTLADAAKTNDIKSPAISIVGKVCALAEDFDWFDNLPLKGRKIVVTRPKERAGTLSSRLRALGADVIEYPCIETVPITPCEPLENALRNIGEYSWLVFTSPAGVEALEGYLDANNLDVRALGSIKIAVIGTGTAKALKQLGLRADYMPKVYDVEHMASGLIEIATGKILVLRAKEGSPALNEIFQSAGVIYDDIAVYDTVYRSDSSDYLKDNLDSIDCAVFTSASTVKGFVSSLGKDMDYSGLAGICIGEQTAGEAKTYGIKTAVSKEATIDSLVDKLLERE
jgi:uroporphyrin-III C-methyltransferase